MRLIKPCCICETPAEVNSAGLCPECDMKISAVVKELCIKDSEEKKKG